MATIGAVTVPPVILSLRPKKATQAPPIKASTPDEADFIKYARTLELPKLTCLGLLMLPRKFIEQAEAEEKKAKH